MMCSSLYVRVQEKRKVLARNRAFWIAYLGKKVYILDNRCYVVGIPLYRASKNVIFLDTIAWSYTIIYSNSAPTG
jgi:hypothetical protein